MIKKITEKQYIKACETIALYKHQKNTNADEIVALFDDCMNNPSVKIIVDGHEVEHVFRGSVEYQYHDIVSILLSAEQYYKYVGDIEREFKIPIENVNEMEHYLKNENQHDTNNNNNNNNKNI